jgi:hypothetical protein
VLVSAEAVRLLHWKAGWVTEPAPSLFEIVLGEWHAYDGHVGYPGRSPAAMHVAEFDQRVRERRHGFLRTTAQAGISGAQRRYAITFVVVAFSVIVQGGTVSWLTRRLRIPQRATEPELWSPGIRFRHEPEGLYRFVVAAGSPRTAPKVGDLHLAGDAWVSLITRDGRLVPVQADTVLRAGDEAAPLAGGDREGHEQGELFIGHQQADSGR